VLDFKKPEKESVETFDKDLTDWLFTGCWGNNNQPKCSLYHTAIEYPAYDGWYNNVGRPELGAVDTPLLRRLPAAYEDGVYKPSGSKRPEPLEISEKLLRGDIGSKSRTGRNVLLVFFGMRKNDSSLIYLSHLSLKLLLFINLSHTARALIYIYINLNYIRIYYKSFSLQSFIFCVLL